MDRSALPSSRTLPALLARGLLASWLAGLAACAGPAAPPAGGPEATAPSAGDLQRRKDFDKALDSWNGAAVPELLRKLGKPDTITRRADGNLEYQYSRSTRAGPDRRAAFSCTVRYAVDAAARRVIGHSIDGC